MAYIFIIIILAVALCLVAVYAYISGRHNMSAMMPILSILLAVVFAFRYMWGRDLLIDIVGLQYSSLSSDLATVVVLLANWMYYSIIVIAMLHPFFCSSRASALLRYYVAGVLVLYISTFGINMVGLYGSDAYSDIRTPLVAVELAIITAIVAIEWIIFARAQGHKSTDIGGSYEQDAGYKRRNATVEGSSGTACTHQGCNLTAVEVVEDCCYVRPISSSRAGNIMAITGLAVGSLVASFPGYILQALVGEVDSSVVIKGFTLPHIALIIGAFVVVFVLYLLLRGRRASTIRHILTYISIAALVSFNSTKSFATFADVADWPIHICNLTIYLIVICLIFGCKRLFAFVSIVSVTCAFFAMLFPNYSELSTWVTPTLVRFYSNHYVPFCLPILCRLLGIFPRISMRDVRYAIVGLFVYFALMLVANAYCITSTPDIDFFYQNGTQITSVLSLDATRNILWQFAMGSLQFNIYPVYFAIYLAVLTADCFVVYVLYRLLHMLDDMSRRRCASRYLSSGRQ